MSKELLDTLENKVFSAVDTIESLRTENNQLREDRKILEDKLQELIRKMSGLENGAGNAMQAETSTDSEEGTGEEESSAGGGPSGYQNPYSEY